MVDWCRCLNDCAEVPEDVRVTQALLHGSVVMHHDAVIGLCELRGMPQAARVMGGSWAPWHPPRWVCRGPGDVHGDVWIPVLHKGPAMVVLHGRLALMSERLCRGPGGRASFSGLATW